MTADEFSDQFDVLYNNITSNQAPGLNTYEKSIFLTKALDELLKNYFNPKGNKYLEGFDDNAKRQIDFSKITAVWTTTFNTSPTNEANDPNKPIFDSRARSIALPEDVMMFINESVTVSRNSMPTILTVVPIAFDEYNRLMSKPFKRPVKNQAWRLIIYDTANKADIVCGPGDIPLKYVARYIRRPKPIIIGDLDGLSIHEYTFGTPSSTANKVSNGCELDESLHEEILLRAIELAKAAWVTTGAENLQPVIQMGLRSE